MFIPKKKNENDLFQSEEYINYNKADVDIFSDALMSFRDEAYDELIKVLDMQIVFKLSREDLLSEIERFITFFTQKNNYRITRPEQTEIAVSIVNDMIGFGPLEKLLHDDSISDIIVNRFDKIYLERGGILERSNIRFRDEQHVMQIAQRIAQNVGRRIDTASPICDARLPDGSRVNIVVPPVVLDGISISIRKFAKKDIALDDLCKIGSMSEDMLEFLKIATKCALNIIVSGGTGSGKTTLLNALSSIIDSRERIVTCEDAAELKLQQPNLVRLESRPENIEGKGAIRIRDLVKNALRMRPDRIIVGEVRGDECVDMLQAMNTGHDGSMSTIHANTSRDALTRLEDMVAISGFQIPIDVIRSQIVGAINLIIHVERLHDGSRKVTEISEIVGKDGPEIKTQILFEFIPNCVKNGKIYGDFKKYKVKPKFYRKSILYGLDKDLLNIINDIDDEETQNNSGNPNDVISKLNENSSREPLIKKIDDENQEVEPGVIKNDYFRE